MSSAEIPLEQRQPTVIPKKHHITTNLLEQFYHEQVAHQRKHIQKEPSDLQILGGKRLVSYILHKCTSCRNLRGKVEQQKMPEIPGDCLTQEPPFKHSGVDVFDLGTSVSAEQEVEY